VLILPGKAFAISVLADVLVFAVAATLGAVVAFNLVDPTRMPTGVVNRQVDLRATRFVVASVLFAVGVRMGAVRDRGTERISGDTYRHLVSDTSRSTSLYLIRSASKLLRYVSNASLYLQGVRNQSIPINT
jgi:hypothetical protein